MGIAGIRYVPWSEVVAERTPPRMVGPLTVTVTPGSIAPDESTARPCSTPVCSCAARTVAAVSSSTSAPRIILRIFSSAAWLPSDCEPA